MVQGGMSCIKYLMFVFNFVFVVCGIVLIVVGAVVQKREFTVFLDNKYVTAPTILIAVGCIIFLLAFLGCFGSVRENHCMVMTFGILLFIVFIIEIAGGITAYVNRNELGNILEKNLVDSIEQNKTDARKFWDDVETELHCCGARNYTDYPDEKHIPRSCCDNKDVQDNYCPVAKVYHDGCYKQILAEIKGVINMVGGVAIGIGIVELIGVMFSWCLASAIKKEYEGV